MGEANRTANTSRQYIEWFLRTGCLLEKNVAGETLQKICPPADVACLPPGLVPKRCRLLERRCVSPGTWSPLARRQGLPAPPRGGQQRESRIRGGLSGIFCRKTKRLHSSHCRRLFC